MPDAKAADKEPDTPASKKDDVAKPAALTDAAPAGEPAAAAPPPSPPPPPAPNAPQSAKPAGPKAGASSANAPGQEKPPVQGSAQSDQNDATGGSGDDDGTNGADPVHQAIAKATAAIAEAERAEQEAQLAASKAAAARAAADAAAEAEYKAMAAQAKAAAPSKTQHTFKRQSEEIFRRDMAEPEFYLDKKDRFPRPVLTPQQQESLTRKAEIPQDQTPEYVPQRVLSPEFEGMSNYERGVSSYLAEARGALKRLEQDPAAKPGEVSAARSRVRYLESLHENFYIGMNVFRTAKGGRSKVGA